MSAPYVCPSCRRNALRHAGALRGLSRTSKATFISLRSNNPRPAPAKETTDASSAQKSSPSEPQYASPSRADALSSLFGVIGSSDRYSRPHTAGEALDKPPQRPPAPQQKATQTTRAASELQAILDDPDKTTNDAWEYFQRHYTSPTCPALKSFSLLDLRRVVSGSQFWKLQSRLLNDWCAGRSDKSLPSPVELVQRYIYLGIMKSEFWHQALWTLNMDALKKFSATGRPGTSLAETMAQAMELWDLLLKTSSSEPSAEGPHSSTGVEVEPPTRMWSSLRLPWNTVRQMTRPHRFFGTRLNQFLSAIETHQNNRIAYSALVTFDILTRDGVESVLGEKFLTDSMPFLTFLAHIIPGSVRIPLRPNENTSNDMIKLLDQYKVSPEDRTALLGRVMDSNTKCMQIVGTHGAENRSGSSGGLGGEDHDGGGSLIIDGEVRPPNEGLANFHYGRINRAYFQKRRLIIYDCWLEAHQALSRKKQTKAADPPVPAKLYELTLEALMAMQLPEQAIKVWNRMIEDGVRPTVKTWTAMIDGCGKAKDTRGMEQMWAKMLDSGVQPDVYAWAVRVSGMMRAAKFQEGLAVLDEMAKTWAEAYKRAQSAAKKKKKTQVDMANLPVKPTTIVLNGAVTNLASTGHNRHILGRILTWAKSLEIQPDIYTYNALISLSLFAGDTEDAMNLLKQMTQVQIKPDVTTFGIILNSIFRSGSTAKLSREEQSEKAMATLRNLEATGVEPTAHIYGTLIDNLLKRHDNEAAARTVLDHMVAKGLEVPPQVFTVLMTHYFDRHDFAAVDALWAHIKASKVVLDTIFFDRMVEQYASINKTEKMMEFFRRMSAIGLSPGWPALQQVVVKLADIGDWDRFEEIVNDVEQGVGIATNGMRDSPNNVVQRFWRAVAWKRSLKPKPEQWPEEDLTHTVDEGHVSRN
ncbi:pentatricopeptide repeat protein [Diplodia corticola]|uniref:Pentatricopeptide repeat protein n=1 Tax=Diplodia corticola TaxID=236234 RepID=A0A1J9RTM9_9PEZI|nr:pentatricopeptide repeat protein [Diplodia corticola]OJD30861.1 pentatricopeptide repeat protein [Diplodia corticola]